MKKYNLSKIMKRAWELVKGFRFDISAALKKAWKEAKGIKIEMCVIGKETFTVDTASGIVTGKTYHAKEFLKDNFNAKWNNDSKQWTVDVDKFNSELKNYADYYKKYIIKNNNADAASTLKTVASKKLVNGNDGFYSHITYTDGTSERVFIG